MRTAALSAPCEELSMCHNQASTHVRIHTSPLERRTYTCACCAAMATTWCANECCDELAPSASCTRTTCTANVTRDRNISPRAHRVSCCNSTRGASGCHTTRGVSLREPRQRAADPSATPRACAIMCLHLTAATCVRAALLHAEEPDVGARCVQVHGDQLACMCAQS